MRELTNNDMDLASGGVIPTGIHPLPPCIVKMLRKLLNAH